MEERKTPTIAPRGVENPRLLSGSLEGDARGDGPDAVSDVLTAFELGTEDPGQAATLGIRLIAGQLEQLRRGEPMSLAPKEGELVALYTRTLSGIERDRRKDANAWSGKSDEDLMAAAEQFLKEKRD